MAEDIMISVALPGRLAQGHHWASVRVCGAVRRRVVIASDAVLRAVGVAGEPHAVRHRPVAQFPGEGVRVPGVAADLELTVAALRRGTSPQPVLAALWTFDQNRRTTTGSGIGSGGR